MGVVLGLSLTSRAVVWVLLDDTDGSIVDHDVLEFRADTEIAVVAARGAQVIAAAGGHRIERVRLTWSDDVAADGLRLRTRLDRMCFAEVVTVPLDCAAAVEADPDAAPELALAHGAAVAEITTDDSAPTPVRRVGARRGLRRIAFAVLGAAAAAAVSGLLLTSGSVPPAQETAAVADQPAPSTPGWVAVSAPSDSAAHLVRKVVEPTEDDDAEAWAPQPVAEPLAVPAEAPSPEPLPATQSHLSGEWPGPATVVTAVPVLPDMTVPANLFTALP